MQEIQLRNAKAALSAIVDEAGRGEASIITLNGKPAAVVLGYEEWLRLTVPSFARHLLSAPEGIHDLPARDETPARDADF